LFRVVGKTTRRSIAELVVAGLVTVGSPAIAHGTDQETLSRVRSTNPSLAALIARATEQSATFRRLIEAINASDGIVYVEPEAGECGHEATSCLEGVTTAGAYRIVWIKVDKNKAECDLIASMGHELQHALEILSDSDVRSGAKMFLFYIRTGQRGPGRSAFETEAATKVGNAVREEIRNHCRRRVDKDKRESDLVSMNEPGDEYGQTVVPITLAAETAGTLFQCAMVAEGLTKSSPQWQVFS
jgi:hypothetical protein